MSYLVTTKMEERRDSNPEHLNPHQARWSMFFARVNFTLSHRLGTKNLKPDALSRQ